MMNLVELQKEIKEIEPTIDFLHEVCGCGQFAEITQTSDGFFLGRAHNDIGFNAFLGKPSDIAMKRTREFLEQLSPEANKLACKLLERFDIPLLDVVT